MEYAVPDWPRIESIVITRTALTGSIPDYVGNGSLRHLTQLVADYTLLSGSLPESLSVASNLTYLSLGSLEATWTGYVYYAMLQRFCCARIQRYQLNEHSTIHTCTIHSALFLLPTTS